MNAPTEGRALVAAHASIPAFAMPEAELLETLGDSIYPGAKPKSIKMVVNYCKANLLDPFQKPVHIVPMSRKVNGEYVEVDTVMPGIGLYRTQAARSGEHAGTSEPEFGPMLTMEYDEEYKDNGEKKKRPRSIQYPEWCKITVFRLDREGHPRPYVAIEYWLENYATQSRWTDAPNAMWKKRPRAQLAKCAEAQALRKAFPELGAAPTADEMEGKWIDENGEVTNAPAKRDAPAGPQSKSEAAKKDVIDVDPTTGEVTGGRQTQEDKRATTPATEGMLKLIRAKAKGAAVEEAKILAHHKIEKLEGITIAVGQEIIDNLQKKSDVYTKAEASS